VAAASAAARPPRPRRPWARRDWSGEKYPQPARSTRAARQDPPQRGARLAVVFAAGLERAPRDRAPCASCTCVKSVDLCDSVRQSCLCRPSPAPSVCRCRQPARAARPPTSPRLSVQGRQRIDVCARRLSVCSSLLASSSASAVHCSQRGRARRAAPASCCSQPLTWARRSVCACCNTLSM